MTANVRNIMLTIAYDGTAWCGWQIQPNGPTVQECIERATERLTGRRHKVLCAGRTDAGVHALGQVANFRTESRIPPAKFRQGLQRFLPPDITIVRSQQVHSDFHATRSAIRKTYRYLIFDGPVVPPMLRNQVLGVRRPLNAADMQRAAQALCGTHDFRCFESNYPNKATSVRTIFDAQVRRVALWQSLSASHSWRPTDVRAHESPDQPVIEFEVSADGFLYNMVRAIVGTLLEIGTGRRPPEDMQRTIEAQDRAVAGPTAGPQGLYLVDVVYPEELMRPESAV